MDVYSGESIGDALRYFHRNIITDSDFLLCSGYMITNINIQNIHRKGILTCLYMDIRPGDSRRDNVCQVVDQSSG
jgi:hypothetical protein